MKTNNAFTLKDLIVTICVVLFLLFIISIIIPALPGCGGNLSDRLKCSVQLRGIGIAISLYQNDYNDMNPVVWSEKAEKSQFGMGWYNKPGEMKYTRWADKDFSNWDQEQTVGGCLYLLVKYADLCQPQRLWRWPLLL